MPSEIPIIMKLKKQSYKELARAQDIIVEEVLKVIDKAVLHGGTAIWRCYNGNRFSEDVDFYIPKKEKLDLIFNNLESRGFKIEKKRITQNTLYSNLRYNRILARFEAVFKNIKGDLKEYIKADGNLITVNTLIPEKLIIEKINAYTERKKIRDLYDIFFLLRYIKDKKQITDELKKFVDNFESPIDEQNLKILIIEGIAPSAQKMLDYIKREI